MFRSGPPIRRHGPPLQVVAAARRHYRNASATARDPRLSVFLSDLVRPYRLDYDDSVREQGLGQSFTEMCQPLIEELVDPAEPVDLLVLAFDFHDLRPGQSGSVYLSHVCPGDPLALAVCDQGNASPFTALELIQTYAETAPIGRALLLVAEQATLHYRLPRPAPVPERHAAVGLLLEPARTGLRPVRVRPGVPAEQVARTLSEELAALATATPPVLLAGAGLSPAVLAGMPAAEIVRAPAGQPCTGTWWELAGRIAEPDRQPSLAVADYDAGLGYLSLAVADPAADRAGLAGAR